MELFDENGTLRLKVSDVVMLEKLLASGIINEIIKPTKPKPKLNLNIIPKKTTKTSESEPELIEHVEDSMNQMPKPVIREIDLED